MILIALGANLASEKYGQPQATLEAAVAAMPDYGLKILLRSRWLRTAPVPMSAQPWYVNGAIAVETGLPPLDLLKTLIRLESDFGRTRSGVANEARVIDLDLLAYNNQIINDPPRLELPHPRLHLREFVLQPLCDIVPDWIHPVLGQSVDSMLSKLAAA